jgi:alkanesulfonate monooxygenase SsuD/methylene tetrahydromethanopterin reductase-like flavin-dependent oxidoreductase (luciferase family)
VKLCLSIEIQEGMSYPDTLAMTRAGESLGFDASLLAEHYYPSGLMERYPGGLGAHVAADAWIYLAGMARETQRIRLGTLVSPVTFRHPSVLAKLAATLDHVSDGRAELGIGAGWLEPEHRAFGFDFAAPARRVDLVEEQLRVITGLWSESPFSHDGQAYTLREAYFTPKPVQQPRPTIIVGGRTTSQRLPRLAARYADEFVIGQPRPDDVRGMRRLLDQMCEANGRDPAAVKLSAFVPFCIAGSSSEVDRLMQTYRETNPQYARMMGDDLSTWLRGTPSEVAAQLERLAASGIDRVMVSVNCDQHREMLSLLPSVSALASLSVLS